MSAYEFDKTYRTKNIVWKVAIAADTIEEATQQLDRQLQAGMSWVNDTWEQRLTDDKDRRTLREEIGVLKARLNEEKAESAKLRAELTNLREDTEEQVVAGAAPAWEVTMPDYDRQNALEQALKVSGGSAQAVLVNARDFYKFLKGAES